MLGLRLWITGLTYVYAWFYRSPWPLLGWWPAMRMVIAEYMAFIVNFVLISPFERWWMGADRLRPSPERPVLLLINGYGCSRAAWWWLRRRLEGAGWVVATISLEPIYTSIENYVEHVSRRIDEVLAATGAKQVILIGHSMGGLVARAYLRRYGSARVKRLLTLGTPHAGSELARAGIGENARQMTPGSAWLKALASEAPAADTLTIFSPHDNFVMPQSNLQWPGAQSRTIDGLGHLAMLYSPRVAAAMLDGLRPLTEAGAD
ncbi:MAG: alpha/beta fold hydrolase [Propionivibrio sp.]|uniref:Alpha/beta fold hydrolase n=1 Tax=Candidatus Propionivibrio dominans TaxID=2954373 RepID=A0A9D7FNL7_9RHOO|nr:alpha/beta fold hydrolase [Candidatus Propionivibrio dominans]